MKPQRFKLDKIYGYEVLPVTMPRIVWDPPSPPWFIRAWNWMWQR